VAKFFQGLGESTCSLQPALKNTAPGLYVIKIRFNTGKCERCRAISKGEGEIPFCLKLKPHHNVYSLKCAQNVKIIKGVRKKKTCNYVMKKY